MRPSARGADPLLFGARARQLHRATAALEVAQATGYDAWTAGRVTKQGERKAVVVPSIGLTFEGDTLQVR